VLTPGFCRGRTLWRVAIDAPPLPRPGIQRLLISRYGFAGLLAGIAIYAADVAPSCV